MVAGVIAILFVGYLAWEKNQAKYGRKIQKPNCISNLKQIEIAFQLWVGDHNNQHPWNVSTNEGGTRELAAVDKDGFAVNPAVHFQAMASELQTPKLLVCPKDASKTAALAFTNLNVGNITYRLHIVTDASPKDVLLVCPIDGDTLSYAGTVKGEPVEDENGQHPMQVSTNFQSSP
jgi:hypothetical protein